VIVANATADMRTGTSASSRGGQSGIRCSLRVDLGAGSPLKPVTAGLKANPIRSQETNKWLDRALLSAERALSPEHPSFAVLLERAANARFLLRDYDSGRQLLDRAIELREIRYGPGSQPVLEALQHYSDLLRFAKDSTRAKQLEKRRKALEVKH
jgi:hypothetical protein